MATKKSAPKSNPVKNAVEQLQLRAKAAQETLAGRQAEMTQFANDNLAALRASSKIVVEGYKPLADEVVASTRRQLDAAVATVKSLQGVKSPTEALKLQREAAKAAFEAARADNKALRASFVKLATDAAAPLKGRVAALRSLAA